MKLNIYTYIETLLLLFAILQRTLRNCLSVPVLQRAGESVGQRKNHGERIDPTDSKDNGNTSRSENTADWNSYDCQETRLGKGENGVTQE